MKHVAVVGASLAGLGAARALRAQGFDGRLTIVGDEVHRPYDRPPLSKELLAGTMTVADLALERDGEELAAQWRLGTRAERLRPRCLELADGSTLEIDGVVLATGATARTLHGAQARPGVHTLRTLDDALALRAAIVPGVRVVVIGAGFIGAEVASTAHHLGAVVTVLEAAASPLAGPLGPAMGRHVAGLHERNGVALHCGVAVVGMLGTDRVTAVTLADGREIPADLVVVGVGARPAIDWLHDSGVALGDGVLCDAAGRTSLPGVVAVGDCAAWLHPHAGHRRTEHWTSARDRPATAVSALLGGPPARRERAPYFWSEQYGVRLQFAGEAQGGDEVEVIAGDPAAGSFLAVYRRSGRPVAVLGVDQEREFSRWRRELEQREP